MVDHAVMPHLGTSTPIEDSQRLVLLLVDLKRDGFAVLLHGIDRVPLHLSHVLVPTSDW